MHTLQDNARAVELTAALQLLGLQLRPDSALCKSYMANRVDKSYTASVVAEICALHKFLYEYTSYSFDCAVQIPIMLASLADPLGSEAAAYSYIKCHEIPILKHVAIEKSGGIPTVWPWITVAETGTESSH